jgi:hypothetical protein
LEDDPHDSAGNDAIGVEHAVHVSHRSEYAREVGDVGELPNVNWAG